MAHYPKPYFRKGRSSWYVQLNGKQHNLGRDRAEAFLLYHKLMAEGSSSELPPATNDSPCVAFLAGKFLG